MNRITSMAVAAALAVGSIGAAFAQTGADDPQHADGRNSRQNGNTYVRGMQQADRAAAQTERQNNSGGQTPPTYDRRGGYHQQEYGRGEYGRGEYGRGDYGHGDYGRGDYGHSGYGRGEERDWRTYGYEHRWHRGDRLPPEYRSHSYVVDDWRGHHLSAPPRGYHWVQQGNDYLLVAIATGIIASVLLNQ